MSVELIPRSVTDRTQLLAGGLGILAESFRLNAAPNNVTAVGAIGATSSIAFAPIGLRAGDTVTGACCFQSGAATGATLAKLGLYSAAGTFQKATADFSGSLAANTQFQQAFAGGAFTAPSDGLYYLALLTLAATTQPTFASSPTVTGRGGALTGASLPAGSVSGKSDIAADAVIVASTTLFWLAAY